MVVKQAAQTELDLNRSRAIRWSTTEEQYKVGLPNPAEQDTVSLINEVTQTRFEGLIHVGQKVFVTGDQFIGRIVKLLPGARGEVSYLVILTGWFWGHQKRTPVELLSELTPKGVCLSIDRSKFQELPDYKTDLSIENEVENALWNDEVLRVTDYHEVDIQVNNGVLTLSGHITGRMSQDRIDKAVGIVKDILGVRNHLVLDDKLLLKVAEALIPIKRVDENYVFAKIENGVVGLSGKVLSTNVRDLAEKFSANVPFVRGVINNIAAPGIDLSAEDQRFLQPSIGEEIFFRDGVSGVVRQVIINRNNLRVVDMIIQGQFPDQKRQSRSMTPGETLTTEQFMVIPVRFLRFLSDKSGFLMMNSTETTRYQVYNPESFVAPNADWVPPYPYRADHVRFCAEG